MNEIWQGSFLLLSTVQFFVFAVNPSRCNTDRNRQSPRDFFDAPVQTSSISQEEMMSEGGDHESWDDEMMMNENNETPLPVVRIPYIHSPIFNLW